MAEMERPQVLNEWRKARDPFGKFSAMLDFETPFDNAMKGDRRRKPLVPLRAGQFSHFDSPRFVSLDDSRNRCDLRFRNSQTKFRPTRSARLDPLIGQNHRNTTHAHRIEKPNARGAHAPRT